MSLQFNPSFGLSEQRNRQQQQRYDSINQAIGQIGQGIGSLGQNQQKKKDDRMNQLLAGLKFKELGINPGDAMNYLTTGQYPQAQSQQSQTPMLANPMPTEASEGMPDTGFVPPTNFGSDAPMPSSNSVVDQHLSENPHLAHLSPYGQKQPQGFASLFQSKPVDYAQVANDLSSNKFDTFNSLTEKQKNDFKETPQYKKVMNMAENKPAEVYTADQTKALMSGDANKIAVAFPNGVPQKALGPAVSAGSAEGRNKYFGTRAASTFMGELPSNSSPSEPAGAAYAVKVAVRQGQSLINKAGSPQAIALAASDLARAVQRSAPQTDVLRGSGFSDTLATRLSMIAQKFTADPSGSAKDVPKVRKEIFDMLADLDKSASPWIENKLKDIESNFPDQLPPDWEQVKHRQRGENLSPIQFDDGSGQNSSLMWQGRPLKDTPANRQWLQQQGGQQ